MPKLPTAEQLGERPIPNVRGGIAPLQLQTPDLGYGAKAMQEFGQAVSQAGNVINDLAIKEKAILDDTRKREGVSAYLNGQLELEDGKDGFANVLGGDAVKRPLVQEYRDKRDALRKQIRDSLGNIEQQRMFDAEADIADRQFDVRLYRHIATQSRAYQNVVYEGSQETNVNVAAKNYAVPGEIDMALLKSDVNVEHKARVDGLDPARSTDREIIDTLKSISRSKIHSAVIETMMMQGKDAAAKAYFDGIQSELTPESRVALGMKVKAASTDGEALRGADQIWQAIGPKMPSDPVRLDLMERKAYDMYKDQPQIYRATVQELRSRSSANNDAQQELAASNNAKVLGAYNNGTDLRTIQTMPEYLNMDGGQQAEVTRYIQDRGYTAKRQAEFDRQYEEGEKARNGFAKFWELSNPRVLAGMSESSILALTPTLGQQLTGDLMQMKRKLVSSPTAVHQANIDSELFNTLASEAGLKPFDPKLKPDQKEFLGRLRNRVEAEIDLAQQALGKPLQRDEKEKIMRREIDRKVMISNGIFSPDQKLPAAAIKPEDRSKIYVPIDQIDPAWLKGAINLMKSKGIIPQMMNPIEAQSKFKSRFERAYGWMQTGGDEAGGNAILEGR